jgi:hypothetical protein
VLEQSTILGLESLSRLLVSQRPHHRTSERGKSRLGRLGQQCWKAAAYIVKTCSELQYWPPLSRQYKTSHEVELDLLVLYWDRECVRQKL